MIIADDLAPYRHQAIGCRHSGHIATEVTFVDKLGLGGWKPVDVFVIVGVNFSQSFGVMYGGFVADSISNQFEYGLHYLFFIQFMILWVRNLHNEYVFIWLNNRTQYLWRYWSYCIWNKFILAHFQTYVYIYQTPVNRMSVCVCVFNVFVIICTCIKLFFVSLYSVCLCLKGTALINETTKTTVSPSDSTHITF